ncbi:MAG: class I SAM-dependent methyltransferase [Ilumatobacter sp.]|uniref:class I SAM-dependent methyltransferase n=1 Tax=Ilumatobacter sp. TaxID=1967498 RepID=UPI003C744B88
MDRVRADLARFYEHEATNRLRGRPSGWRVAWLAEFADSIRAEGRRSVIDVGAGPATDAPAFLDAGVEYVGIDLAVANGVLANESGATVVAASLFDLPFPDASFGSGWSMSTLMHVPTNEVADAMRSICRVLVPGAPLMIGQWGGTLGDIDSDHTVPGLPRLFSLRSADTNRELLGRHGSIERWEIRDAGPDGWEYHAAVLRVPG